MKNIYKSLTFAIAILACVATLSCSKLGAPAKLKYGNITVTFNTSNDTLYCSAARFSKVGVVTKSPILIEIDNELVTWEIVAGSTPKIVDDSFEMVTGEQKKVDLQYLERELQLSGVTASNKVIDARLIVRQYNDSFAYRIIIEKEGEYTIKEKSEYRFVDATGGCFSPNGEHVPFGDIAISKFKNKHTTPVIYKRDWGVVAFHESDLHNFPQLYITTNGTDGLKIDTEKATANGEAILPWRVVLTGDDIADLHSQKNVYLSLSQPSKYDYSWVKPGLSTWDWRVKGCVFGGKKYEMTTESLKRYIDFCARHGLEYFMVDAEWYDRKTPIIPVKGLDLEEVVHYGNEIGVGTFIYYDLNYLNSGELTELDFDKVCSTFQSWGASGIKYGFLGSHGIKLTSQDKTNRCEELIQIAGKHQLMIDFHDHPIPHGGLERQYPNYITREYCHAQMDRRWAFTPTQFTKIACVNLLAGPMDQTNGTYALNTIKSRSKGPRNEYYSTVAAETARAFVTHTGNLSVLLDAPEAYEAFGDIFEFISSMPNRWDEAKYLNMDWGKRIAIARRGGDKWYLGVVYGDEGGVDDRSLDFLAPDTKYSATIYRDAPTTDFKTEKESYEVEHVASVTSNDKLNVKVANGGGYSVIFTPIK